MKLNLDHVDEQWAYQEIAEHLEHFLSTPDGQQSTDRDLLDAIRAEMHSLLHGGQITGYSMKCLVAGMRHLYTPNVLGKPNEMNITEQEEARAWDSLRDVVHRSTGRILEDERVKAVAANIMGQVLPRTAFELILFLTMRDVAKRLQAKESPNTANNKSNVN